jgi:spore germination protein YaaH
MPSFPSLIIPQSVSPFKYTLPKLLWEFDKGYIETRAKYHKFLRRFTWEFLGLQAQQKNKFVNFIHEVRGESSTFDITWPYGNTVIGATSTTPIVITVAYSHNYLNGDSVTITGIEGNTNANGTHVISAITLNTFTLVGTTSNGTFADINSNAIAKLKLSNVKFIFENGLSDIIEKILGPDRDAYGIYNLSINMEQIYPG